MKNIIISILISTLLIQIYGCYSEHLIDKENIKTCIDNKIQIVTNNGENYTGKPDCWTARDDTLLLTRNDSSKNKAVRKIPFSSVKHFYASKFNISATIFAGIGFLLVFILTAGAIASASHKPAVNLSGIKL